jgi:hypothetical protein
MIDDAEKWLREEIDTIVESLIQYGPAKVLADAAEGGHVIQQTTPLGNGRCAVITFTIELIPEV